MPKNPESPNISFHKLDTELEVSDILQLIKEQIKYSEAMGNTRESILNQAKKCVCQERNKTYGEPEDSFSDIASLWTIYLREIWNEVGTLDKQDIAAMMILLKVARIKYSRSSTDNWIDIAGYAACGGEFCTHEDKI